MDGSTKMATPVPPPARAQSARAPRGSVGASVDCCPQAVRFDRPTDPDKPIYGFDDRTNRPERPDNAYWQPPEKAKTVPHPRSFAARDGAVWVSVPEGGETNLKMSMIGCSSTANCTFEVTPSGVAEVVDPKTAARSGNVTLRGKAAGEAVLEVKCRGKLVGYARLWCAAPVTLRVGYGTIRVTSKRNKDAAGKRMATQMPTHTMAEIQQALNDGFRQVFISFELVDIGIADLDRLPAGQRERARDIAFDGSLPLFDSAGAVSGALDEPQLKFLAEELIRIAKPQVALTLPYNIWNILALDGVRSLISGVSINIPASDVALLTNETNTPMHALHEVGHMLGLKHITNADANEIPWHLKEEAIKNQRNFDSKNPNNIMGYDSQRTFLGYGQWTRLARTPAPDMFGMSI